ncbi:MAG: hypothetical protein M1828_004821 [Chrysothrix sp. TS-e1954]|nr:MAG: hypothetical protein M1828_004821 [Chrysothrix sp. TS-e1954]
METGGGFVQPSTLLSPPQSSAPSSLAAAPLPSPRHTPLKSGGSKETAFMNYVDRQISDIQRRFAGKLTSGQNNRHQEAGATSRDTSQGYASFKEAGRDMSRLIDVVWISATPNLQVSYLLNIALLAVSYLPSFPPAPRTMFALLTKLDTAFASLLTGEDLETGEALPGMMGGLRKGLSATEKVRLKSLVEKTRVVVVEVMNAGEPEFEEDGAEDSIDDSDAMGNAGHLNFDEEEGAFDMDVARVYDKTLVELGDTLGGPVIGIPNG